MEAMHPKKSFLYDALLPKMEAMALAVALLGFAAKWFVLQGGNSALLIGLSTLSVVSFLRAFKPVAFDETNFPADAHRKDNARFSATSTEPSFLVDALLPKIINISSAVVLLGMLSKLMFWNGSRIMLTVGVGTLLAAVTILLINQRIDRRALLLTALGGGLLYVSSDTLVRRFHADDPVLVEKMIYRNHHPRDRAAREAVRQHLWQKENKRYN